MSNLIRSMYPGKLEHEKLIVPSFLVNKENSNQLLLSGVTAKVTWSNIVNDSHGWFANHKYTPKRAGYYQINCTLNLTKSTMGNGIILMLYKGEEVVAKGCDVRTSINSQPDSSPLQYGSTLATVVTANGTTDYFEIAVYVDNGNNNIERSLKFTHFSGHFIGLIN